MIKTLAPHMSFAYKFLFVNMDILSPFLKWVLGIASPFTNGIVRTTMAATQAKRRAHPQHAAHQGLRQHQLPP